MSTAEEEVESPSHKPPDSCSVGDVQHHPYVTEEVRHGAGAAERRGTLTREEAGERAGE